MIENKNLIRLSKMYVDHRETPMGTRRICNEVNKWKVKSEKKKSGIMYRRVLDIIDYRVD